MLGVVFTEFVEMVEDQFSPEMADDIIEDCKLASGGSYTSVGTYDHDEMLRLVEALSRRTGVAQDDLVCAYGEHLFGRFVSRYPDFFTDVTDSFTFLSLVDDHIHREVRKLYPTAELPTFACERPDEQTMNMRYESQRPFAQLALGLINGCVAHFNETVSVDMIDRSAPGLTQADFHLVRATAPVDG